MKKIIFVLIAVLLLNLGLVNAITEQEIIEAKSLIDSKADCKNLSNSQLEIIGEYSMEQMHPGKAHEFMHKMMGFEEGSDSEEQFHINMARTIYCSQGGIMAGGMMGMMPIMMNIIGGGIMGGQNVQASMMGSLGYGFGYWNFINILLAILLIGLILLVYLWIIKLWKNLKNNGDKK